MGLTLEEGATCGRMCRPVAEGGGHVAQPAFVAHATQRASFGAGVERGLVPVEEGGEFGRPEPVPLVEVGEGVTAGPQVPGADELAVVATEDPVPEEGAELDGDRPVVLDREIGDAAAGVEAVGGGERARRTHLEAGPATPTAVRCGGRVGREREIRQDFAEQAGGTALGMNETGVFSDPAETGLDGVGFFHEGSAVGQHPETVGRAGEKGEGAGEAAQTDAERPVVIAPEGVAGHVSPRAIGQHPERLAPLEGVVGGEDEDPKRAGLESRGVEAVESGARHVAHRPVAALVEPEEEPAGGFLGQRGRAHPDVREAFVPGQDFELVSDCGQRGWGNGGRRRGLLGAAPSILGLASSPLAAGAGAPFLRMGLRPPPRTTMICPPDASGPRRVDAVATHRRLEEEAQRRLGLGPETLMERAGESARKLLRRCWPWARHLLVLCGTGNNGGDGYTLARRVLETGGDAVVLAWGKPAAAAARAACERYGQAGGRVVPRAEVTSFLRSWPSWSETVLADGLFGLGLSRPLERETADLLSRLEGAGHEILALDIPSGLDAASGQPRPVALPARVTLALISAAPGHLTAAAGRYVGHLEVDPLGLEEILAETPATADVLATADLASLVPPRPADAHKGFGGRVLVVGGDLGYGGAVRLAGEAALRAGAGLVSVVTRPEHVAGVVAGAPSLMVHGLRRPSATALGRIAADVLALGPGLGQGPWGQALWELLVRDPRPLVLDADGLNLLAAMPVRRTDWILTPHPGEAARLLGTSIAEVQGDRFEAARALALRYDATVILKGSGTVVADPDGTLSLAPYALAVLATAGTGDLLTGVVAGLRARGLPPGVSARAAVLLHARAGLAVARGRSWGPISQDLLPFIGP